MSSLLFICAPDGSRTHPFSGFKPLGSTTWPTRALVAVEGYAPSSVDYRSTALLLSYAAIHKSIIYYQQLIVHPNI